MEGLFYVLLRGFAIGVLISAPMGPIGMLVIQRTLNKGRWPAFFTGIGASISDMFYCILTGAGIAFITDFIEAQQLWLQILGSVAIAIFGIYLFRKNPTRQLRRKDVPTPNSYWKDVVSGFLLTVSNPLILFFIIGLFARFNFLLPEFRYYHYISGYLSIAAGATAWWFLITLIVNKMRSHFNVRSLYLVNRIIGSILIAFALVGTITAFL
ncbi:MAG: LysE family transporter [Bacteroides sp.]|nr:LysE family transporter [Bacteroides sp.]MCM1378566.1 LysE family transporter [Bacteroides sp.]MCM1444867.1 LysE family transporter [Prevotella sp.]